MKIGVCRTFWPGFIFLFIHYSITLLLQNSWICYIILIRSLFGGYNSVILCTRMLLKDLYAPIAVLTVSPITLEFQNRMEWMFSLSMKPIVPIKFPRSDFVFHSSNAFFQILPFSFQPICRIILYVGMSAVKRIFRFGPEMHTRLRFHQESCQYIQSNDRPEAGKDNQDYGDWSDPKHRKVKIVGDSPADAENETAAWTV